jgi:hypothetical protein
MPGSGAKSRRFQTLPWSITLFSSATIGEFLALSGWFVLHHANRPIASDFYDADDALVGCLRGDHGGEPPLAAALQRMGEFLASPHVVCAVLVLWAGFIVERSMVVLWLDVPRKIITPGGQLKSRWLVIGAVTMAEIVVWVVWIALAERDEPAFAPAVRGAGIHPRHTNEVARIKQRPVAPVVAPRGVMGITVGVSAGGIWALSLAARGAILAPLGVLLAALFVEHILQVLKLRQDARTGLD